MLQALTDFCDSYGLVCNKPTVWVLHYLNTSGASCESRIIGVYSTKTDGTDAIDKQLGGRIHSKSIFLKGMSIFKYEKEQNKSSSLLRGVIEFNMWLTREDHQYFSTDRVSFIAVEISLLHEEVAILAICYL